MREVFFAMTLLGACGGGGGESGPTPPTTGTYHHYVTTDLRVPVTAELQREYGLDIDGDPAKKPDNQLGSVFVALSGASEADLQGRIDAAIEMGKVVLLHSVRADQIAADGSVSWQVYVGADRTAPPRFDGTDTFEMAAVQDSEPVIGKTAAGKFVAPHAGAGRLTVELSVSENEAPLALDLFAARVEAQVDANGCSGSLGGAITQHDVDTVLIPSVVRMMNNAIARDPNCPAACTAGTSAALIIEVFDKNADGVISEQELKDNSIIQTLLAPDLDLIDDDGIRESISLGLGFSCVGATFTAPGETP